MKEITYARFNPITIIRKVVKMLILLFFVIIIFSVFYQVLMRYVFQAPPVWTEEISRFSLVWLVLLGSSACIRKSRHFNVDYITQNMPKKAVYILSLVLNFLIICFIGFAFYYGIVVMLRSFCIISPALGIPMAYVQLIFPIGFGAMLMEAIVLFYELLKYGPERLPETVA